MLKRSGPSVKVTGRHIWRPGGPFWGNRQRAGQFVTPDGFVCLGRRGPWPQGPSGNLLIRPGAPAFEENPQPDIQKVIAEAKSEVKSQLEPWEAREQIAEFSETVLVYMPKKSWATVDARWRYGTFIGKSMSSDQHTLALADGSVTRARAVVRVVPSALGR